MEPITVVRRVAPEDIRPGDYIAVSTVVESHVFPMCEPTGELRIAKVETIPWNSGEPLCVVAVCLPFILARDSEGTRGSVDVRRSRLVRVSDAYARAAFEGK